MMNRKRSVFLVGAISFFLTAILLHCVKNDETEETTGTKEVSVLTARYETDAVSADTDEDAADDPAIWINFTNPSKSLIVGTNKKAGLNLYNLKGEEVFFIPEGLVNNVDVRYGFDLNGKKVDFAGASNRTTNSFCLHVIDGENQELIPVHAREIISGVDEVYGFCLYHDKTEDTYYAFVNGKNGQIEQWSLFAGMNDKIDAELVRTLNVDSQPEGMVADDETGTLYVGEEGRGVWKFRANPDQGDEKVFIPMSSEDNPAIEYDVEGLALLYLPEGKGYLLVSSQGNNSYAVFERNGTNEYLTSFSIEDGEIDGAEETDGIDITHYGFNDDFPAGFFIVQDGFNFEGDQLSSQNFKLVDTREVAYLIDPQMTIYTRYVPYR